MGLLDDLKKEADTLKNQEAERSQSIKANAAAVDRALRKTSNTCTSFSGN